MKFIMSALLLTASLGFAEPPLGLSPIFEAPAPVPTKAVTVRNAEPKQVYRCVRPDPLDIYCTPFNFSGRDGLHGANGRHGNPTFPHGFDGHRGYSGTSAYPVTVKLEIVKDVLRVTASQQGSRTIQTDFPLQMFPFNTGRRIQIVAIGGHGGRGGDGGRGYRGCASFDPRSRRCLRWVNGRDGRGGDGGSGGNGSDITVYSTPEAQPYTQYLSIHNFGGQGGEGGWGMPRGMSGWRGFSGNIRIIQTKNLARL